MPNLKELDLKPGQELYQICVLFGKAYLRKIALLHETGDLWTYTDAFHSEVQKKVYWQICQQYFLTAKDAKEEFLKAATKESELLNQKLKEVRATLKINNDLIKFVSSVDF